ncbi:uncharacterized protein HaLaN_11032 [Haematococcus lacustris]|uniref:EF-hand domain-containing protein n=1 Tax=Haematococcus lacustris TaxID=44745 RepID=A0A699YX92_HAELA|nr:uncharacterized protein HaLaN_11032 [Haematococcus lacustris]
MLDKPALGAPGNPRWGPGQPLEHFVPTRGLMYSVFSELDHHNAGKLTFSQFEEACVAVGLQQQQTQTLYQQ